MKLTLVFDIDGVLAERHLPAAWTSDTKLFFETHGIPNQPYPIFPGVVELMRFLFSNPNVNIAFFSAASPEANQAFVSLILRHAFPDNYPSYLEKIVILSAPDLTRVTHDGVDAKRQQKHYRNIPFYPDRKDISYAIRSHDASLDQTILIEDHPAMIYFGQEKNYLFSYSSVEDYNQFLQCPDLTTFQKARNKQTNLPIFYSINNIYYLTGVLLECIKKNEQYEPEQLNKFLLDLNFTPNPDNLQTYDCDHHAIVKHLDYYKNGLNCLKTFNPNLAIHIQTDSTYITNQRFIKSSPVQKVSEDNQDKLENHMTF